MAAAYRAQLLKDEMFKADLKRKALAIVTFPMWALGAIIDKVKSSAPKSEPKPPARPSAATPSQPQRIDGLAPTWQEIEAAREPDNGLQNKIDQVWNKMEQVVVRIFLLSVPVIICVLLWQNANKASSNTTATPTAPKAPPTADEINENAYYAAEIYVQRFLKARSSAKFPWYSRSYVPPLGDSKYAVAAYVDSQNSFGAMIRNNFTCVLLHKGGDNFELVGDPFFEK
ncbi:MAG TPA: hypothetical protein VGP72_25235 [Planctomycetota bacterium]